jgi:hypothetical protein
MSSPPPEQCAIGPDGELLDASDIIFYGDPGDKNPLPPVPRADASSTHTAGQATQITQFFRRSARSRKDSSRLTDPNNSESTKRKAGDPAAADTRPSARTRRSAPSPVPMDEDTLDDNDDDMPVARTRILQP